MTNACRLGPVYVTGSKAVSRAALRKAGEQLSIMLQHRPDVARRLREEDAVTAVFAPSETVCDLDYFSDLQGSDICTAAPGGLGGVPGRPATACSENNLLALSTDPFQRWLPGGENVCLHELAHTIMNVGLSESDRTRIQARYQEVLRHPTLWRDSRGVPTYALKDDNEFWAEISQAYFHANPDMEVYLHNGVNGPEALREYDAATFALVDSIYLGSANLR